MRGINACANQAVAHIIARAQGALYVRAIVRVHIHGKIYARGLCRGHKPVYHGLVVRAAGIFRTDGHLLFCAAKPIAYAAHIDTDGLGDALRHAGAAAVAHLFKHSDMVPNGARRFFGTPGKALGMCQQNGHAELVIQKTAFDVTAFGDGGARVKTGNVARADAQRQHIFFGGNVFVQHKFHGIERAFFVRIFAIHMHRGVLQLERAGEHLAAARGKAHVFGLGVVGVQPAQRRQAQAAVRLYLGHHGAQRIQVRL